MKDLKIKVTITFIGFLAEQAGREKVVFSFPEGATYGHLLEKIGNQFGPLFHERTWDPIQKTFRAGILVVGEGRDFHRSETLLRDGEEIKILPLMGGG
ncbi:MAG: MoaD/ThiS family protein [Thermodesulfobacteriota bacterium]